MNEDKSFTFRLPSEVWETIRVIAERDDLSVAQVVRKVLREFVASADNQSQGTDQ